MEHDCALCALHELRSSRPVDVDAVFGSAIVGRRLVRAAGLVHRRHRREGRTVHDLAARAVAALTREGAA
ncbi:hypothetical protein [Desertimonas flava]|uniref:hypothetical protein n=1 Tax=Desertimonas flava TaxID=2064846 RepID=UPI000E3572F0|nr:hypothetical protein [Desertimonas flava]